MTVLFVNACLRGDESRTLKLCREYLEGVEGVKEVNLSELHLRWSVTCSNDRPS